MIPTDKRGLSEMTKTEITNAIRITHKSGLITRKQLADAMGYKDAHSVDKYLKGLRKIGKKYSVYDVSERIANYSN